MENKIGEKIRQTRVIHNLSQENVATELGISVGAYSNIERGKTEITVNRLYQIAKILKVNILDLLSEQYTLAEPPISKYSEKPSVTSKEISELKKQLNTLKVEVATLKKRSRK